MRNQGGLILGVHYIYERFLRFLRQMGAALTFLRIQVTRYFHFNYQFTLWRVEREREKVGARNKAFFAFAAAALCSLDMQRAIYTKQPRRQRTVLKMFLFACAELS
jgi:hypothetical protein